MKFEIEDLPQLVRETKKSLRAALPGYAEAFQKVESEMRRRVDAIVKERESGEAVVPIVHYSDVAAGSVPARDDRQRSNSAARASSAKHSARSKQMHGTTKSLPTLKKTASTPSWPTLPKTNTSERWRRPSRRSTESIGHAPRCRLARQNR